MLELEDRNLVKKRVKDFILETEEKCPPYKQIVAGCILYLHRDCNLLNPALNFKQLLGKLGKDVKPSFALKAKELFK